jgi:hypothetical protein
VSHGTLAEIKAAARLGGTTTPASGATSAKGDMRLGPAGEVMVENKATITKSMTIQYGWCVKVTEEAGLAGKFPALSFQFVDKNGTPERDGAWVAVPEYLFKEMHTAWLSRSNTEK